MPCERLVQYIALMKDAGMSVVRVGESTWSLWEPEHSAFEHAWMDRVVDATHQAYEACARPSTLDLDMKIPTEPIGRLHRGRPAEGDAAGFTIKRV